MKGVVSPVMMIIGFIAVLLIVAIAGEQLIGIAEFIRATIGAYV